jgi:hypothetical protein
MPKNLKGDVRDPLTVEKMRLKLLETGLKRRKQRFFEEMLEQQMKIVETKQTIKQLEAEKETK